MKHRDTRYTYGCKHIFGVKRMRMRKVGEACVHTHKQPRIQGHHIRFNNLSFSCPSKTKTVTGQQKFRMEYFFHKLILSAACLASIVMPQSSASSQMIMDYVYVYLVQYLQSTNTHRPSIYVQLSSMCFSFKRHASETHSKTVEKLMEFLINRNNTNVNSKQQHLLMCHIFTPYIVYVSILRVFAGQAV